MPKLAETPHAVRAAVAKLLKGARGLSNPRQAMESDPLARAELANEVLTVLSLGERRAVRIVDDTGQPAMLLAVGPLRLLHILDGGDGEPRIDAWFVSDSDVGEGGEERLASNDRLFALRTVPNAPPVLEIFKEPAEWFVDTRICLRQAIALGAQAAH